MSIRTVAVEPAVMCRLPRLHSAALLAGFLPALWIPAPPATADTLRTGSGFAISPATHVVTNAHVAGGCSSLRVVQGTASAPATLVGLDERADLAILRTELATARIAPLRSSPPLRLGESVVSFGFPLAGALSREGNLTTGNVSALAGLRDDPTYLQITAPVQPGSSGGPLLDSSAHVIGVVTAKLDAVTVARRTGDIPQNVNFAIKAEALRSLLRASAVPYQEQVSDRPLQVADIAELARGFTVQVECVPGAGRPVQHEAIRVTPRIEPPAAVTPAEPSVQANAPVASDLDRVLMVQQVQLVSVRTPYPVTAPETRELTVANRSDRSVYKVTVGWLDQPLQRCPASASAYTGRRELFVSLKPGQQSKTMGNFPSDAKLFCVIDATFLASGVRDQESGVRTDEAPAPGAPGKPEGQAPQPPAQPGQASEPDL
jgi:hypothetical protein